MKRDTEPETQISDIMISFDDTPIPEGYLDIELPLARTVKIIYKLFEVRKCIIIFINSYI